MQTRQTLIAASIKHENLQVGRLKYHPRFRRHTALITRHLDFAIKNLAYADKLAHHFNQLGRKHVAMEKRGEPCALKIVLHWRKYLMIVLTGRV